MGRSAFVKWLALAFAAARAGGTGVDNEITRQAVQRARMREAIGGAPENQISQIYTDAVRWATEQRAPNARKAA